MRAQGGRRRGAGNGEGGQVDLAVVVCGQCVAEDLVDAQAGGGVGGLPQEPRGEAPVQGAHAVLLHDRRPHRQLRTGTTSAGWASGSRGSLTPPITAPLSG